MERTKKSAQIKHLFYRAAFGMHYSEFMKFSGYSLKKVVKMLLQDAENGQPLNEIKDRLTPATPFKELPEEEVRKLLKQRNQQEKFLNISWMNRMASANSPLLEKMTLFWHGHFACRINNAWYLQQLNNIHRKHALGNFKTMLLEVSKSPAMLSFLNNQQNKKGKPNENFARELMELFTLGHGHYTENDIKEASRAFTGWQFNNKTGFFSFNKRQHDAGDKTFFGKSGSFTGEDIIDMILQKKQVAYFIAEKLYEFFVNDIPDAEHIKQLGELFYKSNYEIKPVIERLLLSDWFYDPINMGNKIKSPVEFLVGLNRQFNVKYNNPGILLQFQYALGQAVFYPPNVAGWPGGKNWIDSSTLLARMKIPSTVINGGIIDFDGKSDPEDEAIIAAVGKRAKSIIKRAVSTPEWDLFLKDIPSDITREELSYFLLAPEMNSESLEKIHSDNIKDMVVQLVSTPAYQLC